MTMVSQQGTPSTGAPANFTLSNVEGTVESPAANIYIPLWLGELLGLYLEWALSHLREEEYRLQEHSSESIIRCVLKNLPMERGKS